MKIIEDDLSGAEVAALLGEHLADMARHSPEESMHAVDFPSLRAPDIAGQPIHTIHVQQTFATVTVRCTDVTSSFLIGKR